MIIAAANLQLAASHISEQHHEIRESLNAWVGQRRPADNPHPASEFSPRDLVSLSAEGQATGIQSSDDETGNEVDADPRATLIRLMIEHLTGHRIEVFDASDLHAAHSRAAEAPVAPPAAANRNASAGYGVEYERRESYSESEQTSFSASGSVVTADGRKIEFSLQLTMTRSYHEESHVSLRLGDAARPVDPLVLNFSGTAAQLVDQRFSFDLNADGQAEQINQLATGSGFLVFDRNGDGKVNDGSELFGPTTDDGFAELAALDSDGNGWIDENDAAFARLGVWAPDGGGQSAIRSLAEAGVGALSVDSVATPFALKNYANQLMGNIRETGIFLQENGGAGTMQQIDLTA